MTPNKIYTLRISILTTRHGFHVLLFFSLLFSEAICQTDSFFNLQNSYSHELDASMINHKNWGAISCYDSAQNKLYIPLTIESKTNRMSILELDIRTSQFNITEFKIPKKIRYDKRCSISGIRKFKDEFYVKICDDILHFNHKGQFVDRKTYDEIWNYSNFFSNGQRLLAFYYDYHPKTSRKKFGMLVDKMDGTEPITVYPPSDFYQLSVFKPNELVCNNANFVLTASISRPVIYSYNQQLEKVDSLIIPVEHWVDPASLLTDSIYAALWKKGSFNFGAKALIDTCSKSLGIKLINDSTLSYTSCNTMSRVSESIVHIDIDGHFTFQRMRETNAMDIMKKNHEHPELKIDKQDVEFMMQTVSSVCENGHQFYITLGPELRLDEGTFDDYKKSQASPPKKGKTNFHVYHFLYEP